MPGKDRPETLLQGMGVSGGVAVGPAVVLSCDNEEIPARPISEAEVMKEIARFERAVVETRRQLRDIQNHAAEAVGRADAGIFEMHQMVLEDGLFIDRVVRKIRDLRMNAEQATQEASVEYARALTALQDDYLRERVADIRDVARRLIRNLMGRQAPSLAGVSAKCVVVANDLGPSETAMFRKDQVLAFVTEGGSPLSHTAIMARALEIPAVVGLREACRAIAPGDELLVDGDKGLVVIHPSAARLREYGKLVEWRQKVRRELALRHQHEKGRTSDGVPIAVEANIETPEEAADIKRQGAEGIGLMRSEYLFMSPDALPDEETQYAAYRKAAEAIAPEPLIIRTLDSGGDKVLPSFRLPPEANPFLGFRAIRFCLAYPEIFRTQLRAILRAAVVGNVSLMYPMITTVEELRKANALLQSVREDLRREGIPFGEHMPVGVMIETPAAAVAADVLAREAAFFSLGTNDLIQYTMAVDRVNDRVAYLYAPTHPAILRLIRQTVEAGRQAGRWTAVCGEMAGDPVLVPLLVGLGVSRLSLNPAGIPLVKHYLLKCSAVECRRLAEQALTLETAEAVLTLCRAMIRRVAPELLDLIGAFA